MEYKITKEQKDKTTDLEKSTIAIVDSVDSKVYYILLRDEADIQYKHNIVYIKNLNSITNIQNLYCIITNKNITNKTFNNIKIYSIEEFYEKELYKIYIKNDKYAKEIKSFSKKQYIQKRFFDLIVSIPALILALPIIVYSAYRIKKESPDGPVFYSQTRVTKNEKTFKCYKLRSMRTDVNYHSNNITENDPRLFKWGKFMRKTRIDEIPQLFNVIKGDIHLIGPRAEWIKMAKLHEKTIPNYNLRHINKTGITGYAQVKCPSARDINETKEKFMHELYYIKNWNIWFEFKILFQTLLVILSKKGK